MGDLSVIEAARDAFKERYAAAYPNAKKGSIAVGAGMLYRFCHEVQIGDYIVFPSKSNRMINIGLVEGPYFYDASEPDYVQQHKVKWLRHLPRTAFTQGALYEIGSALTFFSVRSYADEFLAALESRACSSPSPATQKTPENTWTARPSFAASTATSS